MNLQHLKYGKNIAIYFGASLIPMALNLITNPFIAMNMSPRDYAIVGFYTSFSTLIGPIIVFYLVHYYIKEYFRRDESARMALKATIAKSLIVFSGIVSVVCFGLLYIYLAYIRQDFTLPILPYLALMTFALPFTGLLALEQAQFRMDRRADSYFKITVINGVILICLSLLYVVVFKWGATGKMLATMTCNVVIFSYLLYRMREVMRIHTPLKTFIPIFKFCLPLALSATLGYFTHGYTTTYLESLNLTNQYGIYVVGATIGAYLSTFSTAINSTFQPDLYESIAKKLWKRYIKVCLVQLSLISLIVVAFIVLAPFVIALLTANRYVDSTPYAQILSIVALTSSIYYIINNFSIATNHPKLYLVTTILGSIAIVCLLPYAVSNYGFVGGAWMSVISYLIFALINVILLIIVKRRAAVNT